jgi:hypothetical protein
MGVVCNIARRKEVDVYRKLKVYSVLALMALLLSAASGVVAQESSSEPPLPNEIVFTIPVGTDSGIIYLDNS